MVQKIDDYYNNKIIKVNSFISVNEEILLNSLKDKY